jgi:polysaccharide transporter, PST family
VHLGRQVNVYFRDNKSGEGHGRHALRSGAVSIVARSVNAAIQIGSVLFLARLLSPEDYGLVGMVTAITGFAPVLVDLGSRDAIVQRARITEEEVSALFWITQAVGIGFAAMIAGGGPLIAHFYGEPRLTMIAVVSSLTFITSALTAQHYALLRRAMKFQELGIIEVIANFLGASLAVAMALYGLHYWALVTRPIASAMFLAAGSWIQCRWIPGRPRLTSEVKSMLRFGLNVTGFTMFDFAGKSADRVAIGYRTGAASLGYYQNAAFVYDNLIDIIVGPLHGVAVSALSKLRDNYVELRRSWAKALSTLAFFSAPAFGLLAATSQDLIVLLLGPKWARSGVLLSILALRGIPASIERTCGWLHVTAGRTDRWMRWGMALAGAQFVALCLALPYGPTGIVTAYVVLMFILFIPAIAYSGRPLNIGAGAVCKVVWRPITAALVATAAGFVVRGQVLAHTSLFQRTALVTLVFVAIYLTIVVGILRVWAPLQSAWVLVRDVLPHRYRRLKPATIVDRKNLEHV